MEIESVTIKVEGLDEECNIIEDESNNGRDQGAETSNEKPYKCGICGHRTTSDTLLKVHMKMHLVKRIHQCNICKSTFNFVSELNSHILTHTKDKSNFQCDICNRDFFTEEDLQRHCRVHTKEKPFKCKLCFRAFSDYSYLRVHERSHHGEDYLRNTMKKDGTYVDPSIIQNLNEDGTTPKVFQCDLCQKNFSNEEFLKLHAEVHLEEDLPHEIFSTEKSFAKTLFLSDISDNDLEKCRTTVPVEIPDPSSFHCNYTDQNGQKCLRKFGQKVAYEIHTKTHENVNEVQQIQCHLCKTYFGDHPELFSHMSKSHSTYETDILGFDGNMTRSREIVKGQEKTVFKCTICGKFFPVPSKLRSHMRTHTGEKPFKCDVCQKAFGSAGSLKDHSYLHSSDKPFKCTICKKGFTKNNALEDHIRSHTGEKPYECNICKKKYTTIVILNQHLLAHSKEKPFKCDVCNKSFIYLCNLKYHMVTHTGSKPFACKLCDKSYALKNALKMHMMDHTGEKPHKCHFCTKQFTTVSSLKKHERVHTGEKPYLCTVCNKGFTQTSSLSRHMDSHTGEKPYMCTICNKSLTSASYLKVHLRMHKSDPAYKCKQCAQTFTALLKYKAHLKKHVKEKSKDAMETIEKVVIKMENADVDSKKVEVKEELEDNIGS